jgi:Carboxypeptidase regulatory-like domain
MTHILLAVICPLLPPQAEIPVPTTGNAIVEATGDTTPAMNAPRRRRNRPKRRGGAYKEIEVANGGTIQGVVIYNGEVPDPQPIQIVKDHETCGNRATTRERIKLDVGKHVAEAVVFLGDIKAGKPIPTEADKPVINQHHCTFEPHVQVVIKRHPFEVVNSDPVAHNAKCDQNMMTLFNPLQPKQGMRSEFSIKRPGLANVSCSVHNWMRAYIYVLWHPYYAITSQDGAFTLTDVPPGQYELVVWQEHLGERTMSVSVEPNKTTTIEFELKQNR